MKEVSRGPRRSQRIRKKAMRGVHSSKWQEVKEDEMKSINTNDVWDLEEIPNGAKTVGCNGSARQM